MINIFLQIFLVLCLCAEVFADPSKPTVSGTVANGQQITISGTSFGATGPTIQFFDDFELGSNGASIGDSADAAQIGNWRDLSGASLAGYPTYSNAAANSGSLAHRVNWDDADPDCGVGGVWGGPSLSVSTTFYFSYWMYLPAGQVVPGETACVAGPNWKQWWLSANDVFASDYGTQTITDDLPGTMAFGPIDGGEDRASAGYVNCPFIKGRWARFEVLLIGSTTSSGAIYSWYTDSATGRALWASATGDNTLYADDSTGWAYLHFNAFGRHDTNSNTYFDDIYISTGTGAQARVEIGNNSTYTSCTNLAVATIDSWGDTGITATIRGGSFQAEDTVYLFVVDSAGAVSPASDPITFGDIASTPPTLSGASPVGCQFN